MFFFFLRASVVNVLLLVPIAIGSASDIKYVRLKIPAPVPSCFHVEFLLLSAFSSRTLRLDASLFLVKKQIQKHSDQQHIILHAICATAHHKPAFTAMHHNDAQYQDFSIPGSIEH
jgi:hypothetical protein